MKRFFIFFLMLLALTAITSAAEKSAAKVELPLDPDEYLWHFGMIPRDATVTHHFALTNNHQETVTITKIENDCDCTHVPKTPIAVAPGETYLMKVTFDTKTYFGETNRDIHLVTDYKPLPEMTVYFTSLAARRPNTVNISPPLTAFITGKNSQNFIIENLADEKTGFRLYLDNDSLFSISDAVFTLKGKEKKEVIVSPFWDRVPSGSHYSCLVLEVSREEIFRVAIPIKLNKF